MTYENVCHVNSKRIYSIIFFHFVHYIAVKIMNKIKVFVKMFIDIKLNPHINASCIGQIIIISNKIQQYNNKVETCSQYFYTGVLSM